MDLQGVYSKTAEGAQEITTRNLHLDAMTRRLLIIVDGERSAGELMQFFKQGQDISVLFETLTQLGLIMRTGGPSEALPPDSVAPPAPVATPALKPASQAAKPTPVPNSKLFQTTGPSTATIISELLSDELEAGPLAGASTPGSGANPKANAAESKLAQPLRFIQAQTFMNTTAQKVLGLKGTFFISKIERASNENELAGLLDQFQSELFEGTKDRNTAKQYREQAENILRNRNSA